ncbi:Polyamine aminopropyltransferase [Porphyridium purpureum]|uniref:thermospermine synthase n=1 Tax=Porphyridium purpureum TaxID=35688 RepID=A0A5J4Z5D9_PORPP|nr:Polyamine aminopropyltransferase [Porphyridium purpureum]|eukprot:POR6113..scf295_1
MYCGLTVPCASADFGRQRDGVQTRRVWRRGGDGVCAGGKTRRMRNGDGATRDADRGSAQHQVKDAASEAWRLEAPPNVWLTEPLTPCTVMHHGVRQILVNRQTAFQNMQVVDIGPYGRALVLDQRMQLAANDEFMYHEPLVHLPCVMHGAPKRVLVLGGADGGAAREALKWRGVEQVTLVDIDGEVVEACRTHLSGIHQGAFDDPRFRLHVGDALAFLESSREYYDVILGDLTDPVEQGPSFNLFARESFSLVRQRLTPGRGVFAIQSGSTSLVEEPHLFARMNKTLASVFRHVVPFQSFVPTFGTPLGFCACTDQPQFDVEIDLSCSRVNEVVASHLDPSTLKAFDGLFAQGVLGIPKCVREAIERETVVYSMDDSHDSE